MTRPTKQKKIRSTRGDVKSNSTSWGPVAKWYDDLLEEGDGTFQKNVILPNIIRLVGAKKGLRILDIACGQGFFARQFATLGANVIGVDVSPELIKIANERWSNETRSSFGGRTNFMVASADELKGIANRSVDVITIILALQNIAEVGRVFQECARVLAGDGRLYAVLNHPAFRGPKATSWCWDEKKNVQYRRVDQYLSERKIAIDMHPGEKQRTYTVSFHRPLQWYMKALRNADFALTHLEEWISNRSGPKGRTFAALEQARKEIPLFLCLEAREMIKYT